MPSMPGHRVGHPKVLEGLERLCCRWVIVGRFHDCAPPPPPPYREIALIA